MKKIILLLAVPIIFFSCGKSSNAVPDVAVNLVRAITDPSLRALSVPGGAVILPGYGVAGLLLYREADGSYAAYDACSSYLPQNRCAVTLDAGNFTCTDPCSGSKFSLIDGTPVKAPATKALRSYNIVVSNYEVYVSN